MEPIVTNTRTLRHDIEEGLVNLQECLCKGPGYVCLRKCAVHGTSELRELIDGPKYAEFKPVKNTDDLQEAAGIPEPPKALTGGSSDYYKLPVGATDLLDLIEHKFMSFGIGNIFKACYRLGEKEGTSRKYDLEKIIFFANRELERLKDG